MMASGLAVLCGYFSGGSTSTPAGCMTATLNSIQTAYRATPPTRRGNRARLLILPRQSRAHFRFD